MGNGLFIGPTVGIKCKQKLKTKQITHEVSRVVKAVLKREQCIVIAVQLPLL